MTLLRRELLYCSLCGLWTPMHFSKKKKLLYRLYATLLMLNYSIHMSLQTVYLIKCTEMSKFLASIIFYLTEISVGMKFYLSLTRRQRFIDLLQTLSTDRYCIRNIEEQNIRNGHDKFSKYENKKKFLALNKGRFMKIQEYNILEQYLESHFCFFQILSYKSYSQAPKKSEP